MHGMNLRTCMRKNEFFRTKHHHVRLIVHLDICEVWIIVTVFQDGFVVYNFKLGQFMPCHTFAILI